MVEVSANNWMPVCSEALEAGGLHLDRIHIRDQMFGGELTGGIALERDAGSLGDIEHGHGGVGNDGAGVVGDGSEDGAIDGLSQSRRCRCSPQQHSDNNTGNDTKCPAQLPWPRHGDSPEVVLDAHGPRSRSVIERRGCLWRGSTPCLASRLQSSNLAILTRSSTVLTLRAPCQSKGGPKPTQPDRFPAAPIRPPREAGGEEGLASRPAHGKC